MRYYQIWVSSMSFHGVEPLTYATNKHLQAGEVVALPLRNNTCLGVVRKQVTKPSFTTKELDILKNRWSIGEANLKLMEWLMQYYPSPSGQITSLFVPSNLNTNARVVDSAINTIKSKPPLPPLTKDQQQALEIARTSGDKPIILHGDTGTGKTRVYMEIANKNMQSNRSILLLTPEIGLTPQLLQTFIGEFNDRVFLTHSHLTASEKRNVWRSIAENNSPMIIIGPRSALFMPVKNLGAIIIDEFHDNAYKQEQAPHYQTSRVAAKLAKLHQAQLILGSATPNVADYFAFKSKGLPIVRMSQPATGNYHETPIDIVKLNDRSNFSKSFWLSDTLISKIDKALSSGKQSLIFLNRRGTARVTMCQNCGWLALCPKCDIPMTYHGDIHKLRCHTCGIAQNTPNSCPDCKGVDILFKGVGTKTIFDELSRIFPEASIARFDGDNKKNENLNTRYEDVKSGSIDILVGTQTITKGLDLPKLSVVGIVAADTSLFFPDYTAEEITYQQISQVIGRVGRGHTDGEVVIQTYYPEHSALKSIADKNYSLFYQQQIQEREKFHFPPFSYILKLTVGRKTYKAAENSMQKLSKKINDLHLLVEVIGPAPSFKEKQNGKYNFQLIVKSKKREHLTTIIKHLPAKIDYDIDPTNLL